MANYTQVWPSIAKLYKLGLWFSPAGQDAILSQTVDVCVQMNGRWLSLHISIRPLWQRLGNTCWSVVRFSMVSGQPWSSIIPLASSTHISQTLHPTYVGRGGCIQASPGSAIDDAIPLTVSGDNWRQWLRQNEDKLKVNNSLWANHCRPIHKAYAMT